MTLKFKVDENLPVEAAELLSGAGHDAKTVHDEQLGGRPDPHLASLVKAESRVILTLDLHFADIRTYPPAEYPGIVVLRLARLDKHRVLRALERLLPLFARESLAGRLWIAEETRIRVRT